MTEPDALDAARWLSTGEVAALFRASHRTVIRWSAAGLLPHVVTPGGQRRFPQARIQALAARRFEHPPGEPEGWLRPGEVVRQLRVDPRTVARWSREGLLTSVRTLGGHRRYPRAAIRWMLDGPGGPPG